jgi:hypothetical protein
MTGQMKNAFLKLIYLTDCLKQIMGFIPESLLYE